MNRIPTVPINNIPNNRKNIYNTNNIQSKIDILYEQQQQIQKQILELQNMSLSSNMPNNMPNNMLNNMPNIQSIINTNSTSGNNYIYIDLNNNKDLGSLLFSIANGLSLSYKYNMNIKFINYENSYNIFNSLYFINNNLLNNAMKTITEPNQYYYNKIKLDNKYNYLLNGNFKSFKYFDKYIDKIKTYLYSNILDTITDTNKMFDNLKQNKKTVLLYLNDIEETYYINGLDHFFKIHNINEYKIFLLSNNIKNQDIINKYNIEIINEENPEKLFILMTLFDHYIMYTDNIALFAYYFRNNINATISLLPNDHKLIHLNDIIPDSKLYIDITNKLDNAYIINLESRKDSKIKALAQLSKLVNKPEIYKAPNDDNNINISLSHINILKKAIELNLDYVIVAHDNIKILNEPYILYSTNKIINELDWNVIILSGIGVDSKINDYYSRVVSMQSPICYIVNKKYYQTLLNNFTEGYNKLLKNSNNIIYLLDEHWKKLQDNNWYCMTNKTISIQDNYYSNNNDIIDFKKLFNINNTNICEYLDYIPIIEINNINEILNINPIFYNYKYIIINLFCSKIERSYIKYSIDLLRKNNYELIHLQKPYKEPYKEAYNNINMFTNITYNSSNAYLLNNYLLKKIINNSSSYILNNNFNYNMLRACELILPIFFSYNDHEWINYYNKINYDI